METNELLMNEFKDAFLSFEINKIPSYDDINFRVFKKCFRSLCEPLKYLFNLSIEKRIFPDNLKTATVSHTIKLV